jgi:hypothetical protein
MNTATRTVPTLTLTAYNCYCYYCSLTVHRSFTLTNSSPVVRALLSETAGRLYKTPPPLLSLSLTHPTGYWILDTGYWILDTRYWTFGGA